MDSNRSKGIPISSSSFNFIDQPSLFSSSPHSNLSLSIPEIHHSTFDNFPPSRSASSNWRDHGPYWEHLAPQGDEEWLKVKVGRASTSVSGALVGKSSFETAEEAGQYLAGYKEKEFSEKSKYVMSHGTNTEPEARNWYCNTYKCDVVERGLIVPKWDPTLGASVDGDVIGTDGIIEIKCPLKMYGPIKRYMDHISNGWKPPKNYYDHIWSTHFSQVQHGMAVMGKKWCDYVVYCTTDGSIFTQRIPFIEEYWVQHYAKLKENYSKYVVPYLKPGYPIIPC